MAYDKASYVQGSPVQHNQLIAGGTYTTRKVTILSGQVLLAGAVLGNITASSKHILSLAAAGDGSQVPDMELAHDCDATLGDVEALAFETGQLVGSGMILGAGHTIASVRVGLRDKGLTIAE